LSRSKRDLTTEEKRLWREVAKSVTTRRLLPIVEDDEAPARTKASVRHPQIAAAPAKPSAKAKAAAPPANRGAERKVRRGQLTIDAKIDLHGHTQDRAQAALERFLRAAYARGDRTVIVITGVGRGGEGVIKRRFPEWIADPRLRTILAGYAPAHRQHGGAGAFYVFLKRANEGAR
jgi:DNA-nicking Smr family endonuclease